MHCLDNKKQLRGKFHEKQKIKALLKKKAYIKKKLCDVRLACF